ncbi:MAG: hypothetical protein KJ065_27780 [Anaerolineae bacterium]|nr:hypothetical protein [Anaerolineae bacterium]
MKFCIHVPQETDPRVSKIVSALREQFSADLVIGADADLQAALPESDAAISIASMYHRDDAAFVEAACRAVVDLVSITIVDDVNVYVPPEISPGVLDGVVHPATFDADLQGFLDKLRHRLERLSDARHEYNNIAAVVSLTTNPVALERARQALVSLRANYPEFLADPDNLNERLGLKHEA